MNRPLNRPPKSSSSPRASTDRIVVGYNARHLQESPGEYRGRIMFWDGDVNQPWVQVVQHSERITWLGHRDDGRLWYGDLFGGQLWAYDGVQSTPVITDVKVWGPPRLLADGSVVVHGHKDPIGYGNWMLAVGATESVYDEDELPVVPFDGVRTLDFDYELDSLYISDTCPPI